MKAILFACKYVHLLNILSVVSPQFSHNFKESRKEKNSTELSWRVKEAMGFPGGSVVKNPPANARDAGLIPGLAGSPGEGNGNPL